MYSRFLLFLIPAALLFVAILVLVLWDRFESSQGAREPGNGAPEGAFRSFYHVLWLLMLWSGTALSLPMWASYKQKISVLEMHDRWLAMGKVLIFPSLMLGLLWYGGRKGYLKWIDSLDWPDKENQ
ncbi:MAG: hypothetical protein ACXWQO_08305 [Bdellovibrionota bacterium]